MRDEHMVRLRFHVREVSLQQLAGLWSAIMSVLPEVENWAARLTLEGESFRHSGVYKGPSALAQSRLAFRPHDIRYFSLNIWSGDCSVDVNEDWGAGSSAILLALPNVLRVDIGGTSDREVRSVRDAVQRWAGCHLHTQRRALWIKLGTLVVGAGATGVGVALMDGNAQAMLLLAAWVVGFLAACRIPTLIPAVERRTVNLRIVNAPGPGAERARTARLAATGSDPGAGAMCARSGEHPESPP